MWPLASTFLDIALHRRGPDELPPSRFLLGLLVLAYFGVSLLTLQALAVLNATEAALLLLDCGFFLAYAFAVLRVFRHERRFVQTAAALLGVDVLLSIVAVPLAFWSRAVEVEQGEPTLPLLLRLILLLWWVDVAGFIFGRALARPYIVGVLVVILYLTVSVGLRDLVAPATN